MPSGEFAATLADYLASFVIIFVPARPVYVFRMIHILPEKIAARRGHPQPDAIRTRCLRSLAFGGMRWLLAWRWAYSKPVLYKMGHGTARHEAAEHYEAGATAVLHVLQRQARQLASQFDLIAIRNERLANRIAVHLARGGEFVPAPSP